jgi:23S rRNA G2445 N2-methylase RlmL
MKETKLQADTRDDKTTRCVITCMLPGCLAQIHYQSDDEEVPLYCPAHLKGREHRGYRTRKTSAALPKMAHLFRCPRDQCAKVSDAEDMCCPICGSQMVKHGEVK